MRLALLPIVGLVVLAPLLAGCSAPAPSTTPSYREMGFDGKTWPRLDGVTLTILDHGAFAAFEDARSLFENRTGANVVHVSADDAGSVLQRAGQEKGDPSFDIIYGIDNILWAKSVEEGVFQPYKPLLSTRVPEDLVFFDESPWPATPVDHGYIGVNWDPRHPAIGNASIDDLDDVLTRADLFVTQDPRTSTPGLGFLLATIATYPEGGAGMDWKDYWRGLFANGTLVTSGWTEAYEQHFSAGYGVDYGGLGDKPIVTSYTESPAYEHFFGRDEAALARVVTAPDATFHQVQTMGIAKGTKHLAAAQAWIEFTLTDEFQALAAPGNAVYPVVPTVDVTDTYGGLDPAPGTFAPADFPVDVLGAELEGWIREWTALCEAADCA